MKANNLLLAMLLCLPMGAMAQVDDLYFVPKKKTATQQTTQQQQTTTRTYTAPTRSTYSGTSAYNDGTWCDEDTYNRRPGCGGTVVKDTAAQAVDDNIYYDGTDDGYYSGRVLRFRGARCGVPVSSPLYWELRYGPYAYYWDLYDDFYGYYPYYYAGWYSPYYGWGWNWNLGWGWSLGWDLGWGWGLGWNWGWGHHHHDYGWGHGGGIAGRPGAGMVGRPGAGGSYRAGNAAMRGGDGYSVGTRGGFNSSAFRGGRGVQSSDRQVRSGNSVSRSGYNAGTRYNNNSNGTVQGSSSRSTGTRSGNSSSRSNFGGGSSTGRSGGSFGGGGFGGGSHGGFGGGGSRGGGGGGRR